MPQFDTMSSRSDIAVLNADRVKMGIVLSFTQCILLMITATFGAYHPQADAANARNSIAPVFGGYNQETNFNNFYYTMFQDVHVMMFVGFGFLMTFLKKYGYSAVGFNFLLGAVMLQWSMVCLGLFDLNDDYKIEISMSSLYKADIACATVLISMGAVLGRTTFIQLLIMGILEIVLYSVNLYLGATIFKAADAGGSIFVHAFGAYFGLAAGWVMNRRAGGAAGGACPLQAASYTSDLLAMIGTLFLWLFWPSFNAIELKGHDQHRAIVNTYLSLASSCVSTFAASLYLSAEHKFDMAHVQNATLAGGVAVGATCNLMLQPYGAILVGMVAGTVSTIGFGKLSPFLLKKLSLPDTCGVHNLHGIPGALGGLISILMAGIATEATYGKAALYEAYPARADPEPSHNTEYRWVGPGLDRTAGEQAGFQAAALVVTLILALTGGLITGYILKCPVLPRIALELHYDDAISWELPESEGGSKKNSGPLYCYENRSFHELGENGARMEGTYGKKSTQESTEGVV